MAATRVAVIQSNYLPWKGYFDIVGRVDVFIFYDDVQYTKNDWRNRNRIKTANGLQWLTVPVGTDLSLRICNVELRHPRWQRKHLRSLEQAYGRAPHFGYMRSFLEEIYVGRQWTRLSELNQFLIREIAARFLGSQTQFRVSSDFRLSGHGKNRLLDLLRQVGASTYVSGPRARAYLDEHEFREAGIDIEWMDYTRYPQYPQLYAPFVHEVSVLDLLVHTGPQASRFIRTG